MIQLRFLEKGDIEPCTGPRSAETLTDPRRGQLFWCCYHQNSEFSLTPSISLSTRLFLRLSVSFSIDLLHYVISLRRLSPGVLHGFLKLVADSLKLYCG